MVTIGTMPRVLSSFFRPRRRFFSQPAWPHFWGLVAAMAVGIEHTVGRLNGLLRDHTHRTNDGEFLWRSHWDESEVLRAVAAPKSDQAVVTPTIDKSTFMTSHSFPNETADLLSRAAESG